MIGRATPWRWRKAKPPAFSRFSQPAMASPSGSWSGWSRGFDAYGQGQGERASAKRGIRL